MPVGTLPAKNYIRRSGVAIAYAREGGPFFEIGHISGDISISDDKNFVEVREFGTSRNAYTMNFVDGKSGSVSFQLNLVPTNSAFQALRADNEAGEHADFVAGQERADQNHALHTVRQEAFGHRPLALGRIETGGEVRFVSCIRIGQHESVDDVGHDRVMQVRDE